MYDMPGIPGKLLRSLNKTLARCSQFESDRKLKTVFNHELLKAWRNQVREADSVEDRVDLVIDLLIDQQRSDTRTSLLVLFLVVLRERIEEDNTLYGELDYLARELGNVLQVSISPRTCEEANPDDQHMIFTADWLRLLESIQAVGKVNVPQIIRGQLTECFPTGTGWLVAPNLALTCWHVIKARGDLGGRPRDADLKMQVTNSVLTFDYMQPGQGVEYQVTGIECYDATLDYALLSLKDRADYPLSKRQCLKLDVDLPLTLQKGLYIIQHPKGQPQQNSAGRFVRYKNDQPECILHSAPSEDGTSGAPVLNVTNWKVTALHNGENDNAHLREATLLRAILSHIQKGNRNVYNNIMNAH